MIGRPEGAVPTIRAALSSKYLSIKDAWGRSKANK